MNGHVQMWHKSDQPDPDDQPEVIAGTLSGHVAVTSISPAKLHNCEPKGALTNDHYLT